MSNLDQMPQEALNHSFHVPTAIPLASYKPLATYNQMLAFLVKMRTMLETPCLESMNYIFANEEPYYEVQASLKDLHESYKDAVLDCEDGQKLTKEVARSFQQAWDLVDVKGLALENHTRYIHTISQEMADTYRTHNSPPNKPWRMIVVALAYELKEAVKTRRQIHSSFDDAERKAEKWEAEYIFATDECRLIHQDAIRWREAYMAIHKEFLAGQSLAKGFMQEVEDWIKCDSESARVWNINQALRWEEERESQQYGARSRFKKQGRGIEVGRPRKIFPSSSSVHSMHWMENGWQLNSRSSSSLCILL